MEFQRRKSTHYSNKRVQKTVYGYLYDENLLSMNTNNVSLEINCNTNPFRRSIYRFLSKYNLVHFE